ncbi:unnamed protein product [Sordaria macrospora k-hell]|uniref:WGS project CABT00000000 data, contig 2.31 n=1 Tax=Sordaria macrospora (strain ATCC MYA-333 / DSM 997 / K(L3346) / K-hell) TaxID=771870 RepID=F7W5K6_SORMK|nr:uncharacterized protein SMAC_07638 [Sordaria macrospora k-hell]CCC12794.1 unnamed protein product [Sordaria macrospora k-hell]
MASSKADIKEPATPSGPPYLPPYAPVGGIPAFNHDLAPCILFLVLFVFAAAAHAGVFGRNKSRGRKFVFSMALFGFCMARITAISMRLIWASNPDNPRIAIAANVFILLGGVIVIIVNLFFSQRLLRAVQPQLGWRPLMNKIFLGLLISIASVLVIIIATTVHFFFTLDAKTRHIERVLLLACSTWLTTLAFLPSVAVGYILWLLYTPSFDVNGMDNFGEGSIPRKIMVLAFGSCLTTLGAGFRLGANFDAREIGHATWYHSRAAFYCFNFTIELLIVVGYAAFRIDKLFIVPDGAEKGRRYGGINVEVPANEGRQVDEERAELRAGDRPEPPAEEGREMDNMDPKLVGRRLATVPVVEHSDETAVPSSSTSGGTKPPGQSFSPASSRPLFPPPYTTAPETSTSEGGAVDNTGSTAQPANGQGGSEECRVRFEGRKEKPGGLIEGDEEGAGGSSGEPSIRPVTKIEEEVVVDIPLRITFDGLMEDGAFLGGGSAQTQGPPLEPSQEPPQEE